VNLALGMAANDPAARVGILDADMLVVVFSPFFSFFFCSTAVVFAC
jgi:hypothetical protein